MKVAVKQQEGCKKIVEITLPASEADSVYKELLEEFRQNLHISGFRKGKVPASMIKKRFARELEQEVLNKLVPKAVNDALKKEKLNPVEQPTLDDVEFKEGEPLRIIASFETRPEVKLEKYTGLTVEISKKDYKVSKKEVDEQLETLRQHSATFEPVLESRAVKDSDFVTIDYSGKVNDEGEQFERKGVMVQVVDAKEDGGFSKNLLGAKPGDEKTFDVTFPEDFHDQAVAGKTANYTVAVKEIKERKLPELDDDFARDLGQFENLKALSDEVKKRLEAEKDEQRRVDIEEKLTDLIVENNPTFDLPQVMVQRQLASREREMRRQIQSQGMNPDHIGFDWNAFAETEKPAAEKTVRKLLFLEEIAEKEQFKVTGKEIREEIDLIAASTGRDGKELRMEMMDDGRYDIVKEHIRDTKTSAWLVENNEVKEV